MSDTPWSPPAERVEQRVAELATPSPGSPIRFCKTLAVAFGTSITVDYAGIDMTIASASMFCEWPRVGDYVAVFLNGADRLAIGVRARVYKYVPSLYYWNGSGYSEIPNYGATPTRDGLVRVTGGSVRATVMIRLSSGKNLGTGGAYLAMSLPNAAELDIGNTVAPRIGTATIGYGFGQHAQAGVHAGGVNATSNGNICWFIPNGSLYGMVNNEQGWDLNDFHSTLDYRRA